jgi:prepilin-type N-terminal cleavage/methylation domain-containing protein
LRASIDGRASGFTLVELILALGIMSIIISTLIFMRLEAVERVTTVAEERELRRIAQELLEENIALTMSNELTLENMGGDVPSKPRWKYEWREEVNQEGEEYIQAYTITIVYPDPSSTEAEPEEKRYELTEWVMPTDEQREIIAEKEQLRLEGGSMGIDGYDYGDR